MNNTKRNIIIAAGFALVAAAAGLSIFFLWKPQPKGIVIAVSSLPSTERRGEVELGVRGTPEAVGLAIEQLTEGLDRLEARWHAPEPT